MWAETLDLLLGSGGCGHAPTSPAVSGSALAALDLPATASVAPESPVAAWCAAGGGGGHGRGSRDAEGNQRMHHGVFMASLLFGGYVRLHLTLFRFSDYLPLQTIECS